MKILRDIHIFIRQRVTQKVIHYPMCKIKIAQYLGQICLEMIDMVFGDPLF